LNDNCGDGTILYPHIRFGAVRAYRNSQWRVFQEFRTVLLGVGKLTEEYLVVYLYEFPRVYAP
jgi:hypothetical protein